MEPCRFDRVPARARLYWRVFHWLFLRVTSMKRPRVLLADDHTLFRQGLAKLLDSEIEIVGAVEDGRALLVEARKLRPDLLLVDISMPLLNGLDAVRQLKKDMPDIRV